MLLVLEIQINHDLIYTYTAQPQWKKKKKNQRTKQVATGVLWSYMLQKNRGGPRGRERSKFHNKTEARRKHKTRRGGGGGGEEMGAAESRRDVHTEYVFGSASD